MKYLLDGTLISMCAFNSKSSVKTIVELDDEIFSIIIQEMNIYRKDTVLCQLTIPVPEVLDSQKPWFGFDSHGDFQDCCEEPS